MAININVSASINGESVAIVTVVDEATGNSIDQRRVRLDQPNELDTVTSDAETAFGPDVAGRLRLLLDKEAVEAANHVDQTTKPHQWKTFRELSVQYPRLKPERIKGLLRQGETMNIIAASKVGKSWLVNDLILSLTTGRSFLGTFDTVQCPVLLIDNELHPETSAHRLPRVADARAIHFEEYADHLTVENQRGSLRNLIQMQGLFDSIEPNQFGVIVIDAWYRLLPAEMDENSNGDMAALYNLIDRHAARLKACFILIHHASKGMQGGKAVTDVGSGAGSMSRATDTHLVLREHEEPNAVVMECAVRSFAPMKAMCLRWTFPCWNPALDLDATKLLKPNKGGRPRKTQVEGDGGVKAEIEAAAAWTPQRFATFVSDEPQHKDLILAMAKQAGAGVRQANELMVLAEHKKLIFRHQKPGSLKAYFSTREPNLVDVSLSHTHPPHPPGARRKRRRDRKT